MERRQKLIEIFEDTQRFYSQNAKLADAVQTSKVTMAEELGLKEESDFFLIKDNCLTELEPEEYDEKGTGRTLTCIGFRPLPDDIAHQISRKYQLYK